MKVLTLNKISPLASQTLGQDFDVADNHNDYDAILCRAYNLHEWTFSPDCKAVGRCGAGFNTIPLDKCAENGIVVFNTPGANANAVKELVIMSLFACGRKIFPANAWVNTLSDGDTTVVEQVEKGKGNFVGCEILGKTLGIVGMGMVGRKVAQAAIALGMSVVYYEVADVAGQAGVPEEAKAVSLIELYKQADFITLHVPLLATTKGMINAKTISGMKDGVNIINCARGELAIDNDIIEATASGKVNRYVTDFPNSQLLNKPNIICLPHLGASTPEAEDNCAVMAAEEIKEFFYNKNLVNSVNFPRLSLQSKGYPVLFLFRESGEEFARQGANWKLHDYAIKSNGKYGVAKFNFIEKPHEDLFANLKRVIRIIM